MSLQQPLCVNYFDPRSRRKILSKDPILSTVNSPPEVVRFDYYQYGPDETPVHKTDHHMVCLSFCAKGPERRLGNQYKQETISPGSVIVIPEKIEHWSAWKHPARFATFSLQPQTLAKIAPDAVNPDTLELIPAFASPKPDRLISSIGLAIKQQLETDSHGCDFYLECLFNALLAHLVQNYCSCTHRFKEYSDGLPNYKLKQALEYINDNLDKPIKLKAIAKVVDLSHFYFSHLFKESTGMSPYKYVIQQRVTKAQELITSSKLSLADIAYECGFSSQSQMTHHFRKSVGVTPRVYWLNNQ